MECASTHEGTALNETSIQRVRWHACRQEVCAVWLLYAVAAFTLPAQTLTTLVIFNGSDNGRMQSVKVRIAPKLNFRVAREWRVS
jgi:hypothetical protein